MQEFLSFDLIQRDRVQRVETGTLTVDIEGKCREW